MTPPRTFHGVLGFMLNSLFICIFSICLLSLKLLPSILRILSNLSRTFGLQEGCRSL